MHADPDELVEETATWREVVGRHFHPIGQDQGAANLTLRQVSDRYFRLAEGFRYDGDDVDPTLLEATDLTSVPQLLRWFVSRYGRHTPAALLHDALLERIPDEDPDRLRRWEEADLEFRHALEGLDVPIIRRYLMWAAVSLGSRWRIKEWIPTASIVLWVLSFIAGTAVLLWALFAGRWLIATAAVLAPLLGSALWGRQYRRRGHRRLRGHLRRCPDADGSGELRPLPCVGVARQPIAASGADPLPTPALHRILIV